MAPLDQRDRELLERYKASLAPPEDTVQATWDAIVERVEHEPAELPRSRLPWIGVAVAAALVLGSWVGFQAAEILRDDEAGYRVQSMDRADAPPGAEAPVVLPPAGGRPEGGTAVAVPGSVAAPTKMLDPNAAAGREPSTAVGPEPEAPRAVEAPASATGDVAPRSSAVLPATKPRSKKATAVKPPDDTTPAAADDGPTSLRAELALLGRARAALEAEDFERVLALVQRHAREFPAGSMREEIAMLRVSALCRVGPRERWATARAAFHREFPGSPLAAHLGDGEGCVP